MKIACCQLDIAWENKPANYQKVRQMVAQADLPSGTLLVLPELFSTGFSMNVAEICESTPSPGEQFLQALAREHGIFVMGGLAVLGADERPRNQSLLLSPTGDTLARYSKIHPFTLGGESEHYVAGTEIVVADWQGCLVAPFVCYDLRFPEVFRAAVRQGAQLFTVIANWPVKRDMHWVTLLQARAIENQAYVVGVNRCGTDPKYTYNGRSMIIDPHGNLLAGIGDHQGVITAEVDLAALETWRKDFPALQDMHWE